MSALSPAQVAALASANRGDDLRGRITSEHATKATMRALERRGLATIESRRVDRQHTTSFGRATSRNPYDVEWTATLTPAGWEAAPLRVCTCGGRDYVSCLCNLTPREWLAYAKTNPLVDQGLTLSKGMRS